MTDSCKTTLELLAESLAMLERARRVRGHASRNDEERLMRLFMHSFEALEAEARRNERRTRRGAGASEA
jgi:hypothetical protein